MLGLALAALFIALNGFFVAAEFALVKLRATPVGSSRPGDASPAVDEAVRRLDRYLGVTQLGITLASLGLGWIGEPALASLGDSAAHAAIGAPLGPTGHRVVEIVAFAVLTLGHVLFGELVPKLVAIKRSREAARFAAPLLRVVYAVMYPALFVLETSSRGVLSLLGLPFETHGEAALSEDEILGVIAANVARGPRAEAKREMLERVVRFGLRTAKAAMVPRVDVAALSIDASGREAVAYLRQQQYSRVLLLEGTEIDRVAGYLYVKDLLFDPEGEALASLRTLARRIVFVPESQNLLDVLREMQRTHTPFAVVVDEYGGTSGIVTMEDLLEEIVGEIRDELDVERARIEAKDGGFEVDGSVLVDELRGLGVEVDEADRRASIGAAVLDRLGRLPRVGDCVELASGFRAEVTQVSRRRVMRVRLEPPADVAARSGRAEPDA